jgi:uncharacterized RmlC-like cupin family protein
MLIADERKSRSTIRIIRPDQLNPETLQTSGSLRLSAISAAHGVASALWAGTFLVEPNAKTGIHHHGEQDTVVFVLDGTGHGAVGRLRGASCSGKKGRLPPRTVLAATSGTESFNDDSIPPGCREKHARADRRKPA